MAKGQRGGQAKSARRESVTAEVADDYGDDEFEDYDDDFEDAEELLMTQAPAMPKASRENPQVVASIPAKKVANASLEELGDLDAIQDAVNGENASMKQRAQALKESSALTAEKKPSDNKSGGGGSKKSSKSAKQSAGKRESKAAKYSSAAPNFNALASIDPRVRRARLVRDKVSLASERYAAFDQPPLTDHQIYRLRLRSANVHPQKGGDIYSQNATPLEEIQAPQREVASATADENVDEGQQTEAI